LATLAKKYICSDDNIDYVIVGEPELTVVDLLRTLDDQADVSKVDGLVYKASGEIVSTNSRIFPEDLDSISISDSAWDLIDVKAYARYANWNGALKESFYIPILTSRGCPFPCTFCLETYDKQFRARSPENVVEEIMQLINNYSVDHFWVCDDIFGLKPGWVQRFRNLVRDKSLKFTYKIQSRVDLLLEEDTIDALAESGAETVWVGAESGSQKILDAMDKGTTVEQIHSATKLLKSKGIKTAFFLQFGYLGEEKEDIQKTIDMVLELLPDDIGISVSYPLPGTVFYEKVKDELKTKANWTDSDDLAVMFRSTYPPQFYKKLHRYVHKVYRKKQGINTIKNLFLKPTTITKRKLRSALLTFYYIPTSIIDSIKLKKLEKTG
ncbi:MAG: radical SAM protein, partial [Bacteroidetes bacterium]|nr:radical SAM protein [Bacteroidota bacterium]